MFVSVKPPVNPNSELLRSLQRTERAGRRATPGVYAVRSTVVPEEQPLPQTSTRHTMREIQEGARQRRDAAGGGPRSKMILQPTRLLKQGVVIRGSRANKQDTRDVTHAARVPDASEARGNRKQPRAAAYDHAATFDKTLAAGRAARPDLGRGISSKLASNVHRFNESVTVAAPTQNAAARSSTTRNRIVSSTVADTHQFAARAASRQSSVVPNGPRHLLDRSHTSTSHVADTATSHKAHTARPSTKSVAQPWADVSAGGSRNTSQHARPMTTVPRGVVRMPVVEQEARVAQTAQGAAPTGGGRAPGGGSAHYFPTLHKEDVVAGPHRSSHGVGAHHVPAAPHRHDSFVSAAVASGPLESASAHRPHASSGALRTSQTTPLGFTEEAAPGTAARAPTTHLPGNSAPSRIASDPRATARHVSARAPTGGVAPRALHRSQASPLEHAPPVAAQFAARAAHTRNALTMTRMPTRMPVQVQDERHLAQATARAVDADITPHVEQTIEPAVADSVVAARGKSYGRVKENLSSIRGQLDAGFGQERSYW